MKKTLIRNIFPLGFIVLVVIFLSVVNFKPDSWLSGWDTLHPEFNFSLNFKRIIFGTWREEQGLGAIASHSHMADLPKIIFLYLSSFIFPLHFLRYFYFFLSLLLGPLGVYYFLERVIFKDKPNFPKKATAFSGGLFYLLNLGALQHFYVPFEMFATQYAFLPWLFLFATKFLIGGKRKDLIYFSLVTFLSTPMAYAATLWYIYFATLFVYTLLLFLINHRIFPNFLRAMIVLLVTLIINSYWILPNIYFLATSGDNVPQAKINQLFSEKAFLHDKKYGTFENATILKGFLFDWQEYDHGKFVYLLDEWQRHLQNPLVLGIGFILFGLILLGIVSSIVKREKFGLVFLPLFLFPFALLIHANFPFSYIFSLIRDNFSLLKEGLRFPWTKFSIILMFSYAFYFAQGAFTVSDWLKKKKIIFASCLLIFTVLLIVWMLPAFWGNLISPSKKINLPDEYFRMFSWFDKQPNAGRIGVFPTPTFWGWEYYEWGFEGAGFLWFGLKQPILARDFDRWNPRNENYYWEISYALYSQNRTLFEKVLEKYQINWLLVDGNVINPSSPKALYLDELEEMLATSEKISLTQTFGKIKIYQINLKTSVKDFVFLVTDLPKIEPSSDWNNYDSAYLEYGDYYHATVRGSNTRAYYPFRSLFSGRSQNDLEFTVDEEEGSFIFKQTIPEELKNYQLVTPDEKNKELILVNPNDLSRIRYLKPGVDFDGKTLKVKVPKVGGYFSAEIEPAKDPSVQNPKNCNQFSQEEVKNEIVEENGLPAGRQGKKFLRLTSIDANNCSASFWLPNLTHKISYLITVESRNFAGKSLLFWLENLNIRKADIETYLPKFTPNGGISYFIQPPMEKDGLGYTLHFDNISIGREKTVNDLGKITVNSIPFNFLTSLRLVPPQTTNIDKEPEFILPTEVSHPNPSFYQVTLEQSNTPQTLVLSQTFHQGWQAYEVRGKWSGLLAPILGKRISQHFLINNWANGWLINNTTSDQTNKKIIIFFLPQILEYLGFLSLATFFLYLLAKTCIREKDQIN